MIRLLIEGGILICTPFYIMLIMNYKKEFENSNVYIDKLKCFMVANEENKEILAKFIPTLFNYDVDIKTTEFKPSRSYTKRKAK